MPGPFIHDIDPVIGQIGGMYLWWYGLSYTLGFLTLFRWTRGVRGFLDMDVRQVYDLCISVAAGVLIVGARRAEAPSWLFLVVVVAAHFTAAGRVRPMPRRMPLPTTCVPSKSWKAAAMGRIAAARAATSRSSV